MNQRTNLFKATAMAIIIDELRRGHVVNVTEISCRLGYTKRSIQRFLFEIDYYVMPIANLSHGNYKRLDVIDEAERALLLETVRARVLQ